MCIILSHFLQHDPRLHMYWGRYFNADPEVEEEVDVFHICSLFETLLLL